MSRIQAAFNVIRRYYWARAYCTITKRPILAQGEVIGYFDSVRSGKGKIQIDGWIDAPFLRIETETEIQTIVPEICRDDVRCAGDRPGFSYSTQGTRVLRYGAGLTGQMSTLTLDTWVSFLRNAALMLASLVPFALNNWRDILAYLLHGDVLAGDRLEAVLLARNPFNASPKAKTDLFSRCAYDALEQPVDIIVPVFNAYGELQRCLECLALFTDPRHNFYFVDDASTDPRVDKLLERWVSERDNASLIRNEKNRGFVGSINLALARTTGHVVLLNSDAFVCEDWLPRLMAPLLNDTKVASVTPLSNSAEILSAPYMCTNTVLEDEKANAIDAALKRLNWRAATSEVITGVGYCIALNRRWLDIEPQFDSTFGKGYGEEVDWCLKVARQGAVNLGHGGLFIEHKGASSFGIQSKGLKRRHNQIISKRYPHFDRLVQEFRDNDPMIGPRLVSSLAYIDNGSPISVFLAHDMGGGAELWLSREIENKLASEPGVVVIRSSQQSAAVSLEVHMANGRLNGVVDRRDLPGYLQTLERIELVYSCLAMTNAPLELLKICTNSLRLNDEVTTLIHDFFPLCPSHNLIGSDGVFCELPEKDACNSCYKAISRMNSNWPESIEGWRTEWLQFLERSNKILTFSKSSREQLLKLWPHLTNKTSIEPHKLDWLPPRIKRPLNNRTIVGVLGSIGYQKGAAVLRDLARISDGDIEIVVLGEFDASYLVPGIKVHGGYTRNEIELLTNQYGVTCWLVPSIWPETFCFAARESLATGLPVIGFDLGAQYEALKESTNGYVVPVGCSAKDIKNKVLSVSIANSVERPKSKLNKRSGLLQN